MLRLLLALLALLAWSAQASAQKLHVKPPSANPPFTHYRGVPYYYRAAPRPLHPTVLPSEPSRQEGAWSIYDEVDKLDNSKAMTMTTQIKEAGVGGHLALRCLKNRTEIYVVWPDNVGLYGATVKWRADATPVRTEWWRSASNGTAAFSPYAIPTVNLLFDRTELVLNLASRAVAPRSLSFDVRGLKVSVMPLRKLCSW